MVEQIKTQKKIIEEKKDGTAFEKSIKMLDCNQPMEQALAVMLKGISGTSCNFCGGKGHNSK